MIIYHRNPTEESFLAWINQYPESLHPCDMKRFYVFIQCVKKYHAKRWEDYTFFKKKIKKACPTFSEEKITYFYEKMLDGLTLLRTYAIPYISSDDSEQMSTIERKVIKGKVVSTQIKNN